MRNSYGMRFPRVAYIKDILYLSGLAETRWYICVKELRLDLLERDLYISRPLLSSNFLCGKITPYFIGWVDERWYIIYFDMFLTYNKSAIHVNGNNKGVKFFNLMNITREWLLNELIQLCSIF